MTKQIISIKDRKGKILMELDFDQTMTIGELKRKIAHKTTIPEV